MNPPIPSYHDLMKMASHASHSDGAVALRWQDVQALAEYIRMLEDLVEEAKQRKMRDEK
jgi:hypothetical protein